MRDLIDTDAAETGRRIGHDLFRHGINLMPERLPLQVREGYLHAASAGTRATSDRFVRKWLQLRLSAFRRRRVFDARVTPALLREMDVPQCPVTREALTHGELKTSDWSIDRLNNDGAYAANNLAVMSTRANHAKGDKRFDEVCLRASLSAPAEGMAPAEWQRLAAMMLGPCFALTPAEAPLLPEVVPVTAHRLLLGMQQFQHLLCMRAKSQSGRNALQKALRPAAPDERSGIKLRLLLEAVHTALKSSSPCYDVWLSPPVMNALSVWRATLCADDWALASEIARRLCGGHPVSARRLDDWHLGSAGYRR